MFSQIVLIDFRKTLRERLEARKVCGPYTWTPTAPGGARGFYQSSKGLEMDRAGSSFALRLKLASDVEDAPREVRHCLGFYTDEDQIGDLMVPIIARLPRRRGFLAGWTLGKGMAACLDLDTIHETEEDAARAAFNLTESAAEREREYQAEERAKLEAEERAAAAEEEASRIGAAELAAVLRTLRPDTGNRYATRTVRTKGAAAFKQWQETCRALAFKIAPTERRRAEFFDACGMNEP